MSRCRAEFQRLFGAADASVDATIGVTVAATAGATTSATTDGPDGAALFDAQGRTRALVLELARPADWGPLSAVWQGVQADLGLPAPAIAVSGSDGIALWFSLAQPVDLAPAQRFLALLRARYLADLPARRLRLWPAFDAASGLRAPVHAPAVPAQQGPTGPWSAFVAPDLAPVFDDTPWLDMTPPDDGQAQLLRGLRSITPDDWQQALVMLEPAAAAPADPPTASPADPKPASAPIAGRDATPAKAHAADAPAQAQRFLLSVMNDPATPLALRIDAAKALLRPAD